MSSIQHSSSLPQTWKPGNHTLSLGFKNYIPGVTYCTGLVSARCIHYIVRIRQCEQE